MVFSGHKEKGKNMTYSDYSDKLGKDGIAYLETGYRENFGSIEFDDIYQL